VDELVTGLRKHAKRSIDHHVREVKYAQVTDIDPLMATLHDDDLDLDDDDLVLGAAAKKWDADVGIEPGDTLALQQMSNGDWLVLEVVSENDAATPMATAIMTPQSLSLEPVPLAIPVLNEPPEPVFNTILLYGLAVGGGIMLEAMLPNGTTRTL
jgi:hypothetical protein